MVSGGPVDTGLATSGESHGLTIAPNGWVIYIGRGDCRTDAERGALVDLPALGRILDHSDPNVGIGCGNVHVWDPEAFNGTVNSGVTRAGVLAVYGDGGQGGERTNQANHKLEYGLLGVTTAPDFMQTGHIYMQYFPSFNPNSSPPGLPFERRVSKISRPRISRFTMDLETKQLDLDSEVRIFEYDAQIFSCCHVGGGMGFDSAGNLYVTTGDTNSSQGTGGYSGNNQPPTCPTGPDTEASSAHCGSAAYSYQDARRTAGNTNDYNGKMLRFKPVAGIPDGVQPPVGVGSTYTLPGAERAERAEPVQRHRGRRRPDQAGDLRDGAAQPVAAVDRHGDRHGLLGLGRPGRRRRRAPRSAPRRTRTRPRSPAPATTAGRSAWAPSRRIATASRNRTRTATASRARPTAPATCPAARRAAAPTAGTTATTSSTTRSATPA